MEIPIPRIWSAWVVPRRWSAWDYTTNGITNTDYDPYGGPPTTTRASTTGFDCDGEDIEFIDRDKVMVF